MSNLSVEIDKEKIDVWLKCNIIDKLAQTLKQPYESVTWDLSYPQNCFYLSNVTFININFKVKTNLNSDDCSSECFHLVLKKPASEMSHSTSIHEDALFHNEILFYKLVSRDNNDFPHCFYYSEDKNNLQNTAIVMEHIGFKGYDLCPKECDIPFEYIISGMKTIGKFHAMSYIMKKRETILFKKIVDDIEESRFFPGDDFNKFINFIAMRPITWLRKQNYDESFVDLMENYMSDAFENIMMHAIKPVEPLAVLCHGDFTRNNIYFRKNEQTLDGMLIDFAMMRYAPPSIDTSTFLYLSCSNDDRKGRFNEIFEAYHNTLIENIRKAGINDIEEYSYEKMLTDYKRNAMQGYIIALFFKPILRGDITFNKEDLASFDPRQSAQSSNEAGGDELSKEFSEMLVELRETGCLDHIFHP